MVVVVEVVFLTYLLKCNNVVFIVEHVNVHKVDDATAQESGRRVAEGERSSAGKEDSKTLEE